MRRTGLAVLIASLMLAPAAFAQDDASAPGQSAYDIGAAPASDQLLPGEYQWADDATVPGGADQGQLIIVVSLDEQRAFVYRNGSRIAVSTISSGKPGRETPTGVYPILQKEKMHHSNLYDDAPMPFMQRLTWDGVALHAGKLPGHPASHGCVRLPKEFAKRLFSITERGQTVVISPDGSVASLLGVGLPEYLAVQVGSDRAEALAPAAAGDGMSVTFESSEQPFINRQ